VFVMRDMVIILWHGSILASGTESSDPAPSCSPADTRSLILLFFFESTSPARLSHLQRSSNPSDRRPLSGMLLLSLCADSGSARSYLCHGCFSSLPCSLSLYPQTVFSVLEAPAIGFGH
jgi:hypothetical protein